MLTTPSTRVRGLVAVVLAAGVGVLAAAGLDRGWWAVNHPSRERFPIRGIDVSHHQGPIDWRAVATEPGIAFAYIKATEGGDWVDPRFAEHWREARRAGLRVGAYHFFTFCRPPLDQARHFLSVVPHDSDALPPVVDLEFGGNCNAVPTREVLLRDLGVWLREVEAATGVRPMIYLTHEAEAAFLSGTTEDHPRWVRDIWREPEGDWAMWQYSARGRVRGINALTDLNVVRGKRLPTGR